MTSATERSSLPQITATPAGS